MFNLATQTSGMNFVEENGGGSVPAAEKGWNVILYHYSAGEYLHAIAKHGLTVGDVPTNIMAGLGKIGVWLSSADHPDGNCLGGSAIDKSRFRFAVEVTPEDPLFGKMDGLARMQRDGTNDRVSRAFERCDAAELVGLFRLDQRTCTSLCSSKRPADVASHRQPL
jgi:hypothetical protein